MRTVCLRPLWFFVLIATLVSSVRAAAEGEEGERPKYGYWSVGEPRFFVAARPELGLPYAKPYVSAGYGLPHWIWTGIDVNAILIRDCFQVYTGIRAATPVFDLAFGVRDTWSFNKPFLAPQESYDIRELQRVSGDKARYWAWEGEAVGIVPLPYSALVADFIAIGMLDKPKGAAVFDESYRAIVSDDLYFVMRGAALARFLNESSLKLGVLVEHVFATGREPVTRLGPMVSLQITDHLDANAVLTVVVSSPDHLGLVQGSYGVLGLRYRWASGERDPEPPWAGKMIPF
jgi:hypothetical protein